MKNLQNVAFNGAEFNLMDKQGWKDAISAFKKSRTAQENLLNAMSIAAVYDIDFKQGESTNITKLNQLYSLVSGVSGRETNNCKLLKKYLSEVFKGVRFIKSDKKFAFTAKGKEAEAKRTLKDGVKNVGMFKHVYKESDSEPKQADPLSIKTVKGLVDKIASKRAFIEASKLEDTAKIEAQQELDKALIAAMVESFGGSDLLIAAIKSNAGQKVGNAGDSQAMTEAEKGAEALKDADKVASVVKSAKPAKVAANA